MLAVAPFAGVDLDDLERLRRRLAFHDAEYDRKGGPSRRAELVRLMDEEMGKLASAYKKLELAVAGRPET
jgi:hypothetical protein